MRLTPSSLLFASFLAAPLSGQASRQLSVRQDLLIDAATADLSEAFNMAVSRRGEIAVGQPEDSHVKVFSPAGTVTVVGRSGEGPGEFRRVTRVGFLGDSLWVLDPMTARISLFGPDFKLVRMMPEPFSAMKAFQSKASEQPLVHYFVQALLPGGDYRALAGTREGATKPAWAADVDSGASLLVRISPTGEFKRRLAVAPVSQCTVLYSAGKSRGATRVPFCPERIGTEWDGGVGIAAVDVLGSQAKNARYRVTLIREGGDTVFARTFPFTPIAVTKAAVDSADAWDANLRKRLPPEMAKAMPKPKGAPTYPPVRRVVLGRDNTVWLELRTTTGGHQWLMLDQKGNPAGSILLPNEVTLNVAERGTFWGLIADADGLQGVVRYRVTQ